MNKKISFILICFLIGEFSSLLILNFNIYISIYLKGYHRIIEPNVFVLFGEFIGLAIASITFFCFIINYIKKILFND